MKHKLIIALDNLPKDKAKKIVDDISTNCEGYLDRIVFKVNDLVALVGFEGLKDIFKNTEAIIMIDSKYYDIGNTVVNYLSQLKESGLDKQVEFLTVHASNGGECLNKISEAKKELGLDNLKILAVTLLTSLDSNDSQVIYGTNSKQTVLKLANLASKSNIDGIVCSPLEAKMIREVFGEDLVVMTPGIRFSDGNIGDQKRVSTPAKAIQNGADHIVMGRDILNPLSLPGRGLGGGIIASVNRFFEEIEDVEYIKSTDKTLDYHLINSTWNEILEYIGVVYKRKEGGRYCRLASGLLSDVYINIGVLERYSDVLRKISLDLRSKLISKNIFDEKYLEDYVIMGAQMGSVRISSHLADALGVNGQSIYTEKGGEGDKEMLLKRHDIDLKGKKIILSEDIITAGSTIKKMTELVSNAGGEVVGICCVGNRSNKEKFYGIPLLYCFMPPVFNFFYDSKTPENAIGNSPKLPEGSLISEKPKNDWVELTKSN